MRLFWFCTIEITGVKSMNFSTQRDHILQVINRFGNELDIQDEIMLMDELIERIASRRKELESALMEVVEDTDVMSATPFQLADTHVDIRICTHVLFEGRALCGFHDGR